MLQKTKELEKEKPEDQGDLPHSSGSVPEAGIEPARPLLATGF